MNYYSKQTQSNPTCSELACGEQGRTVEPISKAKKNAAARAYDARASELFGEYAALNFRAV